MEDSKEYEALTAIEALIATKRSEIKALRNDVKTLVEKRRHLRLKGPHVFLTPEGLARRQRAYQLRQQGHTFKQIASDLNVSTSRARDITRHGQRMAMKAPASQT